MTALILAILASPGGYEVYTNTSGIGLGCVLMQHEKVIAYGSRQLQLHEKNYPVHDFELATMVHALKLWCYYLCEEKFTIYTDHQSLKYVFSQRDLNLHQQ